jgi:arginine decarboxylase
VLGGDGAEGGRCLTAADWLRLHHRIHLELADHRRLMALVGFAHTDADVDRLIEALTALVDTHADADHGNIPDVPHTEDLRMETVMLPRDAFLGNTEMVPWRQAPGRVSAEMICPYPPGIPITAPANASPPRSSTTSSNSPPPA